MAYLPKNKYKVLYTNGETYKLKKTGKSYKGEYIKLTDGRLFAGNDPNDLQGKLIPILNLKNQNILSNSVNNRIYQILDKKRATKQDSYISILSDKPIPTPLDYDKEYFNRYISVKLNTKKYQEISEDTFVNFNKRNYNKSLYKVFFIKWSLTENNESENTILLSNLDLTLPGIFNFFPNKSEYKIKKGLIRLTPNARIHIDGKVVDKNLPASYQLGNSKLNTMDNGDIPQNQYCGNCIFNQKGYCNNWKAKINHKFWCRAYKGIYNQEASIDPLVLSPLSTTEAQPSQDFSPQPDTSTDGTSEGGYTGGGGTPDIIGDLVRPPIPSGPSGPSSGGGY